MKVSNELRAVSGHYDTLTMGHGHKVTGVCITIIRVRETDAGIIRWAGADTWSLNTWVTLQPCVTFCYKVFVMCFMFVTCVTLVMFGASCEPLITAHVSGPERARVTISESPSKYWTRAELNIASIPGHHDHNQVLRPGGN